VQGKINRGRHTDHPDGRHSIRTIQCLPPPSPIFLQAGCPSCRPTNSIKALKATSCLTTLYNYYSILENRINWRENTHFGSVLFDAFDNLFELFQELFSATRRRHCPDNRHTLVAALLQDVMTKQLTASESDFCNISLKHSIQLTAFQ